jgi:hypothetical protein
MGLIKNCLMFIFSAQEKFIRFSLRKTFNSPKQKKRKKIYGKGYLLSLDSVADVEKNQMEEELTLIIKNTNATQEGILNYIQEQGTPVFYLKNSFIIDMFNEGFNYPERGLKGLLASLILNKKLSFKIDEFMIIPSEQRLNLYILIYHLYNWFAFKHGIAGVDAQTQRLLNKYLYNATEADFSKLNLSDIYSLKDAISQDKAAIEFIFKLFQKTEGSKQALEKLKDNGTVI